MYFPDSEADLSLAAERIARLTAGEPDELVIYGQKEPAEGKPIPAFIRVETLNNLQIRVGFKLPAARHIIMLKDTMPERADLRPGDFWAVFVPAGTYFNRMTMDRQDWKRFRAAVEVADPSQPGNKDIAHMLREQPPDLAEVVDLGRDLWLVIFRPPT